MMQIAPLRFLQSCRLQVAVKPSWSAGAAAQYKPWGHWQRCAGQRRAAGNRNSAPDEAPVCSVCRRHQRRVVLQGGRELNAEALHCRRERTNAGSRTLSVLVGRCFGAAASIAAVSHLLVVVVRRGQDCGAGRSLPRRAGHYRVVVEHRPRTKHLPETVGVCVSTVLAAEALHELVARRSPVVGRRHLHCSASAVAGRFKTVRWELSASVVSKPAPGSAGRSLSRADTNRPAPIRSAATDRRHRCDCARGRRPRPRANRRRCSRSHR